MPKMPPNADKCFAREQRVSVLSRRRCLCYTEEKRADQGDAQHDLTREISDRARERAWLRTGRTNYMKATHRRGRGSLHRLVRCRLRFWAICTVKIIAVDYQIRK